MRRRTNSLEIPTEELRLIVLTHVAKEEGLDVHEFVTKADLHFFDAQDRESNLDSVVIAWDGVRRG